MSRPVTREQPAPGATDGPADPRIAGAPPGRSPSTVRSLASWPAAIFWSRARGRARAAWLILLPLIGAFMATVMADAATAGRLPLPAAQLVVSAAPAGVAVVLVVLSQRFLGARRGLAGYGLSLDRRWIRDAVAGFGIGVVGVSVPFLLAMGAGRVEVAAVLDRGTMALWPGILLYCAAMLFTGLWEELVLRGVFLATAADGLRRWLPPRLAVAGGLVLSGVIFGLGHVEQATHPALILTWVLPGIIFGLIYVLSGNLAIPIGAHAAFNITANVLFARTDIVGVGELSALVRVDVDPGLTFLRHGAALEAGAFVVIGILASLWIRYTRGVLAVDLDALDIEDPEAPKAEPRRQVARRT
jgi:uncharacterized protein